MKHIGKPQPSTLAVLTVGAVLALTGCSNPSQAGSASPAPTAAATSSTQSASGSSTSGPPATPGASATVGALVAGFPQTLIPVMPGATVVSSSFEKSGNPATAALVGTIKAPAANVLAFYTQAIEAQGFKAVPGDAVGSTASKDFLRGDNETANVAVVESAGVSTFTVGANVAAGSIK